MIQTLFTEHLSYENFSFEIRRGCSRSLCCSDALKMPHFCIIKAYYKHSFSGPVHTTLEEFENGGFTLKTHEMFSVHTTPEEFKNATITGHFGTVWNRELTQKCKLKCYVKPLENKLGVSPSKGNQGTTRGRFFWPRWESNCFFVTLILARHVRSYSCSAPGTRLLNTISINVLDQSKQPWLMHSRPDFLNVTDLRCPWELLYINYIGIWGPKGYFCSPYWP